VQGGQGGHTLYYQQRAGTVGRGQSKPRPPNVALPLDNEDYLIPSPQSPPPATPNTMNNNKNPYMDLIGPEPKCSSGMFVYPPPHGYTIPEENCPQMNNYGRLVLPDFIPHSGVVSMDNPEYILQEAKRRGFTTYQTLGIPVVPSPTSSSGPSSLPAPPYTSLSSTGSTTFTSSPPSAPHNHLHTASGLNGALAPQAGSQRSHPRSSDGESDHEYYNDVDRLKRELQPLHQPRNETTV